MIRTQRLPVAEWIALARSVFIASALLVLGGCSSPLKTMSELPAEEQRTLGFYPYQVDSDPFQQLLQGIFRSPEAGSYMCRLVDAQQGEFPADRFTKHQLNGSANDKKMAQLAQVYGRSIGVDHLMCIESDIQSQMIMVKQGQDASLFRDVLGNGADTLGGKLSELVLGRRRVEPGFVEMVREAHFKVRYYDVRTGKLLWRFKYKVKRSLEMTPEETEMMRSTYSYEYLMATVARKFQKRFPFKRD